MTNETELMPCPFCGGDAIIEKLYAGGRRSACKKCHVRQEVNCKTDIIGNEGDIYAIKQWNTRADAQSVPEGFALVPLEIINFLNGSEPLCGEYFGSPHPDEKGAYWWRTHLRKRMIAAAQKQNTPPTPLNDASVDLDALKREVTDLPSVYKIDSVHRAEQCEDRIRVIEYLHQRGLIVYGKTQSTVHKQDIDNRGVHDDAKKTGMR